jgi:hypothetical protein
MGWFDSLIGMPPPDSERYGNNAVDREWNRRMAEALLLGKADQNITHGGWAGALMGTGNVLRALTGARYRDLTVEGEKKERNKGADAIQQMLDPKIPDGKSGTFSSVTPTKPTTTGAIPPAEMFNPGFDMKKWLQRTATLESGGNVKAGPNKYGYRGPYQLGPDDYKKYGITPENEFDWATQDRAATGKAKGNYDEFSKIMGRPPSPQELYLSHLQGVGGATSHLRNPDQPAWISMLQTAEGRKKGKEWALQTIRENVPKNMRARAETITSKEFADFWTQRFGNEVGAIDEASKMALGAEPPPNIDPSQAKPMNMDRPTDPSMPIPLEGQPPLPAEELQQPLPGQQKPVQLAQAGGMEQPMGVSGTPRGSPSTLQTPPSGVSNRPLPNAMPPSEVIREIARNTTIDPSTKAKLLEQIEKQGAVQKLDTNEGVHMWDSQGRYSFIPKALKGKIKLGDNEFDTMSFYDPETKSMNTQIVIPGQSTPNLPQGRGAPRLGGPNMGSEQPQETAQLRGTTRDSDPTLGPGIIKPEIPSVAPPTGRTPPPKEPSPRSAPVMPKTGNPLDAVDPYVEKGRQWKERAKNIEGANTIRQEDIKKSIEDGKLASKMLRDIEVLEKLEHMPGTQDISTGPFAKYVTMFKKTWNDAMEKMGKEESKFDTGPMTVEQMFNRIAVGMAANAARQSDPNPTVLQFQKMLETQPGLETTPEGRRQIIQMMRKSIERDIAVGNKGRDLGLESPREWADMIQQIDNDPDYKYTPNARDIDFDTRKKAIRDPKGGTGGLKRIYVPGEGWKN